MFHQQITPYTVHVHPNSIPVLKLNRIFSPIFVYSFVICFPQYIVSGSDDFNVYIWEVPGEWADQDKLITVGRAFLVLRGHRSIVNQVRFNSASHMLISAGVEKVLKVGRQ